MPHLTSPCPRILLVHEDIPIRELLLEYLTTRGYVVECVSETSRAKEFLSSASFDALLTQKVAYDVDGMALLVKARSMNLPCIFVTDNDLPTAVISAFRAGVSDYLLQPFELKEVHAAIQHSIEHARKVKFDTNLAGIVSLFDLAESTRTWDGIGFLGTQILRQMLDKVSVETGVIAMEKLIPNTWSTVARSDEPELLSGLDLSAVRENLGDQSIENPKTVIAEQPSKFYLRKQRIGWLALRPIFLSTGEEDRVGGALVLAGRFGSPSLSVEKLLFLARYSLMLSNALSRVRMLKKCGS